jgi:TonB family protein
MKIRRIFGVLAILTCFATICCAQVKRLSADRIEAPEAWTKGNLLHAAEPEYPAQLREQGIAGKVVLKIVIDKSGTVVAASPSQGNQQLSDLVLAAVRQWKFRPYFFKDKAVEVETTATVDFSQTAPFVTASKPYRGPMRLRVSQGVAQGNLRHKVPPRYPLEAKQRGIQGDVILEITISQTGEVARLTVLEGDPLLAQAAAKAVQQ